MADDDVRKKRNFPKDDNNSLTKSKGRRQTDSKEERSKKPCNHQTKKNQSANTVQSDTSANDESKTASVASEAQVETPPSNPVANEPPRTVLDLETALQTVMTGNTEEKEFLSLGGNGEEGTWVQFRRAHSGDAARLASWYRKTKRNAKEDSKEETQDDKDEGTQDSLERQRQPEEDPLVMWLADGFGNEERTPPAVFGILAHTNSSNGNSDDKEHKVDGTLAGVALLTLEWQDGKRVLRVPWFHVEDDTTLLEKDAADVLRRRLWLRLSTIALMTDCDSLLL